VRDAGRLGDRGPFFHETAFRRWFEAAPVVMSSEESPSADRLWDVEGHGVSPVPGFERWSYSAFRQDHESESISVPVVRDDGGSAEFTVPKFVEDPADLRAVAMVVIEAFERWEAVQGLGA
jgi:hypothetical protein